MPDKFGSNPLGESANKDVSGGSLGGLDSTKDQGLSPLSSSQVRSPIEVAADDIGRKDPFSSPSGLNGIDSPGQSTVSTEPTVSATNANVGPTPLNNIVDKVAPDDSSPAPNTDDFLKSILNENNQTSPASSPSAQGDRQILPPAPAVDPSNVKQPNSAFSPVVEDPNPVSSSPGGGLENVGGKAVSEDLITSMQKPPAPAKSYRVLSIVAIIVIIALAGYSIYSIFFAKPKTVETPVGESVSISSPTANDSISQTAITQFALDEQRKTDLMQIQQALISYAASNGSMYPVSSELVNLNSPGNLLEKELVPNYLSRLPADPDTAKFYAYKSSDGKTFSLTAVLENVSDSSAQVQGGKAIYTVTPETVPAYVSTSQSVTAESGTVLDTGNTTLTPVSSGSFGF